MFILKEVKVVCFDTLLQVLILKNFHCTKAVQLVVCLAKSGKDDLGPLAGLQKTKTPAEMLAVQDRGAMLPDTYYTR